ncbi:Protein of unknown function [Cotesia congregata]|uniref:Uncharacterized protein n=1 Tax=Cotesia congregata TaxID=51543 RepID=A0A8J2EEV4_COTCN|nr:Protein of unknown function [Cotesia congregata]
MQKKDIRKISYHDSKLDYPLVQLDKIQGNLLPTVLRTCGYLKTTFCVKSAGTSTRKIAFTYITDGTLKLEIKILDYIENDLQGPTYECSSCCRLWIKSSLKFFVKTDLKHYDLSQIHLTNVMFENVRPQVIKKAALVLQDSEVYQHCKITLDFHREKNSTDNNNDNSSEKNSSENINNVDDIEDNLSDDNSEEEEPVNIEDESTLLMTQAIVFAPGEGQLPVSLFDKYTEALSFLKIYGGKLIKKPEHITYQNWIKSEIMRSDRRCATIIKLFFSALKLRTSKIASSFVRKRKKSKIIRFINYNEQIDKDNFIRENVMLFVPWLFDDPTHEGDIAIDMNENGAKNKKKADDNKDVYYTSIPRLISEEDFINLPCIFIATETWIKIKDDITVPGYEIVYRVNVAKTRL